MAWMPSKWLNGAERMRSASPELVEIKLEQPDDTWDKYNATAAILRFLKKSNDDHFFLLLSETERRNLVVSLISSIPDDTAVLNILQESRLAARASIKIVMPFQIGSEPCIPAAVSAAA